MWPAPLDLNSQFLTSQGSLWPNRSNTNLSRFRVQILELNLVVRPMWLSQCHLAGTPLWPPWPDKEAPRLISTL